MSLIKECPGCGVTFTAKRPGVKYCSLQCGRRAVALPTRFLEIKQMYDDGLTQREIADKIGTNQARVSKILRRNGVLTRKAVARKPFRGPAHPSWVGDQASYATLHNRVEAARGKPSCCDFCGKSTGRFEWANASGRYEDVNDYFRLCKSCHEVFDRKRREVTGAPTCFATAEAS